MRYYEWYDFPAMRLGIAEEDGAITDIWFWERDKGQTEGALRQETPLIAEAKVQLQEYFDGKRQEFHLPLAPKGTEFQKRVWKALCEIPYGETRSYKEIAQAVGNEKACRAVGLANNRNPIVILVPCHRVIGTNKTLVGYGGGLDIKAALLELEQHSR